jgi:hypothetical protein
MSVIQVNVWICELCQALATRQSQVDPFTDPVVVPPGPGWGYAPINGEPLACPTCMAKHPGSEPF